MRDPPRTVWHFSSTCKSAKPIQTINESSIQTKAVKRFFQSASNPKYEAMWWDEISDQIDIKSRYKAYNNPDGNSPTSEMSATYNDEGYPTSASTLPNVEDINQDNNLNETESYFQYRVDLKPQNMVVGSNYITDKILATEGETGKQVYWYQFLGFFP